MTVLQFGNGGGNNKGLPGFEPPVDPTVPLDPNVPIITNPVTNTKNTLNGVYLTVDGSPVLTSNKKELALKSDTLKITHQEGELRIEGDFNGVYDQLNIEGALLRGGSW